MENVADVGKKRDTRERILRRAIEMVEQGGEAAIRVNDIAAECDVSITSLYHYFGNRDRLIEAVQAARYADFSTRDLDSFAALVSKCRSANGFKKLVTDTLGVIFSDPQRAELRHKRLEILGSAAHRPNLARALGNSQMEYNKRLGQILVPAQLEGWIRSDIDVEVLASFFMGIMNARVVIEVGDQDIDDNAWNSMALSFITSNILV